MNRSQKEKFTELVTKQKQELLTLHLKTNAGRSVEDKEANYTAIFDRLQQLGYNTTDGEMQEALKIVKQVLAREVEIQKPPSDNGAARKLVTLQRDSSTCQTTIGTIDVRLDIDQLKHQPSNAPIGTRIKGGGNRFVSTCTAAWHQANTMAYMGQWANTLAGMKEGDQKFHGQATPVNGIHYEGFCLLASGKKYVLFHCYPANSSPLKQ